MIITRGFPSALVTKGYAAPSGAATGSVTTDEDRWHTDREARIQPRPWWWKKNVFPGNGGSNGGGVRQREDN